MAYEMLMGLNVIDDAAYQEYREAMMPILTEHGGGFGYDFRISEVLRSASDAPINRVFTIYFPDEGAKNAFFSNEAYLAVRQKHFEAAVADTTVLAKYER
ncbi:MAG: DUF1330 domain-containing protein [Candidatus Hydrogenedentes bacterium]|nr:DUF1330 domain-containing protein [Candidatus Hydrogenedentota bacterium]